MKRTHFVVDITDDDELDIGFDVDAGRIVAFRLKYRALIGQAWCEIMRYDTAHGRLHVHRFWEQGGRGKFLESKPSVDYTTVVASAKADLDSNWRVYRARMEALQ